MIYCLLMKTMKQIIVTHLASNSRDGSTLLGGNPPNTTLILLRVPQLQEYLLSSNPAQNTHNTFLPQISSKLTGVLSHAFPGLGIAFQSSVVWPSRPPPSDQN